MATIKLQDTPPATKITSSPDETEEVKMATIKLEHLPTKDGASPGETAEEGALLESTPQRTALANEYILKELFGHLSYRDLKSCRLVNKVWNQEATRAIIPKAPVLEFLHPYRMGAMGRCLETLKESWNFPCRKFSVHSDLLRDHDNSAKTTVRQFFQRVAPIATHLKVVSETHAIFPSTKLKKKIEYPNLKSVELYISSPEMSPYHPTRSVVKSNIDLMYEILENSPKLETVSLGYDGERGTSKSLPFQLLYVFERVPWERITHLKLRGRMLDLHFKKIMELGKTLKLETFDLEQELAAGFRGEAIPIGKNFQTFLESQSKTLVTLKLQFARLRAERGFTLPQLPKLTTLQVKVIDEIKSLLLNVDSFSQQFPVLESVSIYGVKWPGLDQFIRSKDMIPVETVKELKLEQMNLGEHDGKFKEAKAIKLVRHVVQMFPRITKLTIPVHLSLMKAMDVQEAWKNLEEMTLLGGQGNSLDSALTGYSSAECSEIQKSEMKPKKEKTIFKFLHQLTMLKVVSGCGLSDLGCNLVLLKLQNLKRLGLIALKDDGISEPVIREMKAKFRMLYTKLEKVLPLPPRPIPVAVQQVEVKNCTTTTTPTT